MKKSVFAVCMALTAVFSLLSFLGILFFSNPAESGMPVIVLFFVSVFFLCAAISALLLLFLQRQSDVSYSGIFFRSIVAGGMIVGGLLLISRI